MKKIPWALSSRLFQCAVVGTTACLVGCGAGDGLELEEGAGEGEADAEAAARLTPLKIMTVARNAGLPCNRLVDAVALAYAESGGRATVTNRNRNGSVDVGLWQINSVHGFSLTCLKDPACNAGAMIQISGRGANWRPWVTYVNGAYRRYLPDAQAAYRMGVGGCR